MSYEVTATRKRPQTFEQLAGQQFVAATLEKSIETGRIAHAYLFSGPRGCGKTSTARILAKALNCEKGSTPQPCGVCDSCKSIAAGSSLDVIEIDGASNTSVENVRQIKDEVLFPPNSSRYKIYIIDEVHMLSTSAFNALLKTIEEPPPYVVFMFATTEPHKVPATIKSRCQQFSFRLVQPEILVELLQSAAADIQVEAEPEALLWIARESGGSVRDAYTLFDQIASFAEGNISAMLIREKLGLVGQDRMNSLFGRFVAGDSAGSLASLEEILSGGVSPEQFISDTVEYCRALLLLKNGITRESLLGAPLSSFDLSIGETLSAERVERLLSIFLAAYRNLKESIDPRYELDLVVAKASHILDYIAPGELSASVEKLKKYLEGGPIQGAAKAPFRSSSQSETASRVAQSAAPLFNRNVTSAEPSAAPAISRAAASAAPSMTSSPGRAAASPAPGTTPVLAPNAPIASAASAGKPLINPQDIQGLKTALVDQIRSSNVMLAAAMNKSRSWTLDQGSLHLLASSRMEADLLEKFSGIIAEILAQKLGSPCRIQIGLVGDEQSKPSLPPPHVRIPEYQDNAPVAPTVAEPASSATTLFRESPAPQPSLSEKERESISLVERLFKAKNAGFIDTTSQEATEAKIPAAGPSRVEDISDQDL